VVGGKKDGGERRSAGKNDADPLRSPGRVIRGLVVGKPERARNEVLRVYAEERHDLLGTGPERG